MVRAFVNGEWVDLEKLFGMEQRHIPRALREPDEAITHVSSLQALYGPWVDPRSGAVLGHAAIAERLGRGERQSRRILKMPEAGFIAWAHGIPASHVSSLAAFKATLDTRAREAHLAALRKRKGQGGAAETPPLTRLACAGGRDG